MCLLLDILPIVSDGFIYNQTIHPNEIKMEATKNLTKFIATEIEISPELLRSLGQLLPNLTTLAFRDDRKFVFDEKNNAVLNLKDNANLEVLERTDINNWVLLKEDRFIFIRIKWASSDEYVFYKIEKKVQQKYLMIISPYPWVQSIQLEKQHRDKFGMWQQLE